jgi:predicted PurR-regulated permease PerM
MKQYRNIGQLVVFILMFVLFIVVVHQFIIPTILGLLVSLVFRPVYNKICNGLGNRRRIGAGISTFIILLCVVIPLTMISIYVWKDVLHLARQVNQLANHTNPADLDRLYAAVNRLDPMSREQFDEKVNSAIVSLTNAAKTSFRIFAGSLPRAITSLIFFLIAFYFGLLDGPRFVSFLRENSPFSSRDTSKILNTADGVCDAVVLGSVLAGLIQGTILGGAYWILGIPKPFLFAALTFIFGLIPLVGSGPAGFGGTIYLLATGHPIKALIMLGAWVLAGISDNIVKPLVLKGKVSLHPFLGLISVLGGLKAFGIAGVFLGPLITGLTIVLLQVFHHRVKAMRQNSENE